MRLVGCACWGRQGLLCEAAPAAYGDMRRVAPSFIQLLNRDNLHRCKLACMGSWMHWVTSVAYQKSPKPVTLHLYHVRKPWYHHRRLEMEL